MMLSGERQRMSRTASCHGGLVHDLSFDDVLVEDILRGALGNIGDVRQVVEAAGRQLRRTARNLRNDAAAAGRTELPVDALVRLRFQYGWRQRINAFHRSSLWLPRRPLLRLHSPILIRGVVWTHRLRVEHLWPTCELPQHFELLLVHTRLLLFAGLPLQHANRECLLLQALRLLLLLRDAQSCCRIRVHDLLAHHRLI